MGDVTRSSGFVALVRLPWGDGFVEPGEPVPYEAGRNYTGLLKRRQIAEAAVSAAAADPAPLTPATAPDGWVDLRELDWHRLRAAIDAYGLELPRFLVDLTTVGTNELLHLAADHGHTVIESVEVDAARNYTITTIGPLGAVVNTLGADERTVVQEVEIPDALPDTRAALIDLAAKLDLPVVGTGSKGYVKEADLVDAITAEKLRRQAAAAPSA